MVDVEVEVEVDAEAEVVIAICLNCRGEKLCLFFGSSTRGA